MGISDEVLNIEVPENIEKLYEMTLILSHDFYYHIFKTLRLYYGEQITFQVNSLILESGLYGIKTDEYEQHFQIVSWHGLILIEFQLKNINVLGIE